MEWKWSQRNESGQSPNTIYSIQPSETMRIEGNDAVEVDEVAVVSISKQCNQIDQAVRRNEPLAQSANPDYPIPGMLPMQE